MDLQGARAIVTGGASGIGAACVAQLRAAGARVVALDLARRAAPPTRRCGSMSPTRPRSSRESPRRSRSLGGLDVAILSAGVGGSAALVDMTTEEWDRVMNVNLRGAFVSLRECAQGDGRTAARSSR